MTRLLITGGSGFIGTNYIARAMEQTCDILNLDIRPPRDAEQMPYWKRCDIMDSAALQEAFDAFRPTRVIHMAALTTCIENVDLYDTYRVNIEGTKHVLEAINACGSIQRVLIFSSQYVSGPEHSPRHDTDYGPHTVYGQSKVLTETLTREAGLSCVWTIVRPVNIWGPWHMRYRREAWRIIRKGLYVHPAGSPVVRTYGYVGNLIWQCEQILDAAPDVVAGQVFNVGDEPVDIFEWANTFSLALRNKRARKVPRPLLRLVALCGDLVTRASGKPFPLTSTRYRSMTQNYHTPMDKTFTTFGPPPYSLKDGVERTAAWLDAYGWNTQEGGGECSATQS